MNNLELEITGKAYNDMEIISDYIAKDNKSAANKMMKSFYKTFKMFLKHPNIGKSRKDFTYLDVKFYVVKKNYLIVYRIVENKKITHFKNFNNLSRYMFGIINSQTLYEFFSNRVLIYKNFYQNPSPKKSSSC